jgi:hypothetical protein
VAIFSDYMLQGVSMWKGKMVSLELWNVVQVACIYSCRFTLVTGAIVEIILLLLLGLRNNCIQDFAYLSKRNHLEIFKLSRTLESSYDGTFSGFCVSAARLGLPDVGLISYGEMVDQGRLINEAVSIPVIGDGDNGYGNSMNIKRTIKGYINAGFAGIMLEDQVRCPSHDNSSLHRLPAPVVLMITAHNSVVPDK